MNRAARQTIENALENAKAQIIDSVGIDRHNEAILTLNDIDAALETLRAQDEPEQAGVDDAQPDKYIAAILATCIAIACWLIALKIIPGAS